MTGGLAVESGLKVEAAAIRLGEAVFSLPRPNRHHNVMWWLHTLGISAGLMHDSGFVLSDGTYADRKRAMEVAKAAGQLIQRPGQTVPIAPPDLYSEDLWEGGADLARPEALWTMATRAPSDAALVAAMRSALALLPGGVPDREAIARVIDPEAFSTNTAGTRKRRQSALAKADAIIAMLSASPEVK